MISGLQVKRDAYDGPAEIHAFIASNVRGLARKVAVFKTAHFSHERQIFSETFPLPPGLVWAVLVLEAYIQTKTDDKFTALTKQGHALVDLASPDTIVRFASLLSLNPDGRPSHDYAGISLRLRVKGVPKGLSPCPYPTRTDLALIEKRFVDLDKEYYGPSLVGKKTVCNDRFCRVSNPIYVFNGQAQLGALFWASIEPSGYGPKWVEHCARLALTIIDPTMTLADYLASDLHSECPTYFIQLVAQVYAVSCHYVEDTRYDFDGPASPNKASPVDSFDLLPITNSGDCEDKDRAIWDMVQAMSEYLVSGGDASLVQLLSPLASYTPFTSLVSNQSSDGHMAHFNFMLIHKSVQRPDGVLACASYDGTLPPLIIIDSIRPSWTLPKGFLARHPSFAACLGAVLKWQPPNPSGRFVSCAAMTPKIHELDSEYPSQLVVLRLECAPQTVCGRAGVYAAIPCSQGRKEIGILASDLARTDVPLVLFTTPADWETRLGSLAFRHPPVAPQPGEGSRVPRGGIPGGLAINVFIDTEQETKFDTRRLQETVKNHIKGAETVRLNVEARGVRESVLRLVAEE
jgi:hypothetical protein